jgi:hypothetical protein
MMNEQSVLVAAEDRGAPIPMVHHQLLPEPADERFEIEIAGSTVSRDRLLALRALLLQQHGSTPVRLLVEVPDIGRVVINIAPSYSVRPNPELRRKIAALFRPACAA